MLAGPKCFRKHAWRSGHICNAFLQDRILFLLSRESWNSDFAELYETFFQGRRFTEFDLFGPLDEFQLDLEVESVAHRQLRLTLMPKLCSSCKALLLFARKRE
jgi:hypothetical protein